MALYERLEYFHLYPAKVNHPIYKNLEDHLILHVSVDDSKQSWKSGDSESKAKPGKYKIKYQQWILSGSLLSAYESWFREVKL